jgi:hypothetical protein
MSRFVRASKFRHVYGTGTKKELCYDNVKPSRSAWDTNLVKANPRYVACCWEASGGGAFLVVKHEDTGKLAAQPPLFQGHKAVVLDIDFHPFNDFIISSASEDTKVMIWNIPEDLKEPVNDPVAVLGGHARKVGQVLFHPTADNTLASAAGDLSIKIWDITKGQEKVELLGNQDLINSLTFNSNGNLLATASRDKKIRVFDVRSGKMTQDVNGHEGVKGSRIEWLKGTDRIATTGFSKTSDRQMFIWDLQNMSEAIVKENLDTSAGILMPFYDEDTKMLYLAGKGDGNVRYYEMVDEKPWQFLLSEYKSADPQRGMAFLPKRACNVTEVEVAKAFKLHTSMIEPISFKVPRKTDVFQDDIFPDAISGEASMTCDEFFGGKSAEPKRISLKNGYVPGTRKEVAFAAPSPMEETKKDLDNPKNEKELKEAWLKLKQENEDLKNKLSQRDVVIRQLELKLGQHQ